MHQQAVNGFPQINHYTVYYSCSSFVIPSFFLFPLKMSQLAGKTWMDLAYLQTITEYGKVHKILEATALLTFIEVDSRYLDVAADLLEYGGCEGKNCIKNRNGVHCGHDVCEAVFIFQGPCSHFSI
jgi:hypothetical protein